LVIVALTVETKTMEPRTDHELGPFLGEAQRGGGADAAPGSAGHDGHCAFQSHGTYRLNVGNLGAAPPTW
jgi:hypothetical protein